MDYDLTRLSWRSFEHLVQALSAAMFGPGIVIFGDGRDGGREATFRGSIEYSPTMNWEGYTVVQAKFRQRPEGTTPDGRWAEAQLRSELASYQNENGRPRPDNYIFATNVILGSSESGQKDRCVQALASASETLGITNYDIWDYDKIKTLLDLHDGVRKAYRAWITSGDVLSQLLEDHDQAARGANAALTSYLAKELLADHYVNLEQAGHAVEEKIPLSRVFVDLPSAPAAMSEQGLHGEGQGVVRRVLELASEKLDGEALQGASEAGRAPGALTPTQRLVLKGGPGQGKTTVGQFICQVLRAALLREASSTAITEEARQALAALDGHCQDQNLAFPAARRFPVRVVLNTFASALAKPSGPKTLLDFIYESVERRSSDSLPRPSLQELLETYPWLVVLDGLDEVPASSNRTQVLESISDFWSDVAANNVDILVVATTRPQGYNDDFAPDRYHHEQLLPLTPSRALDYGERLTKARFPGDDARQEKILKRLKRAASSDTTARLMTSPLQVTIMTALVDQRGQPPQERWSLFHDYYNVIFHREMERDIPAASILRDYRPDVDAIHHRVGLLLQALVEQRSHTEARLSSSDLAAIVRTRLSEEGHQDPQAA
ncbi:MAG TPA: hypothetical protein VGX72_10970, partial [Solirubrobacteraceae bacterium]|nr:hypothetical protein [Solirubrobacteraceae bacterium]